jgi:hypothetical protein
MMAMVTRTSAELLLLAALLAAAWMAAGRGVRAPGAVTSTARVPVSAREDPVGQGLGERASRLRAFLSAPPPRVPARRNLFAFPAPRRAAAADTRENAGGPVAPVVEARPELTLSGIAEDAAAGGTVRTAMIVAAGQLWFAKEGDRVLSRFVVLRIAADAVQVRDTERGEVFTLAFR